MSKDVLFFGGPLNMRVLELEDSRYFYTARQKPRLKTIDDYLHLEFKQIHYRIEKIEVVYAVPFGLQGRKYKIYCIGVRTDRKPAADILQRPKVQAKIEKMRPYRTYVM